MSAINVTKWGGKVVPYDRSKIRKTLDRYGLSENEADEVMDQVEGSLYEGIPTKEIYQLIEKLSTGRTRVLKRDLRSALGEMKSKPDFEVFIQQLLGKMGYEVRDERIIPGRCVNHEIDGVAEKDGKLYYIETKHHSKPHIKTQFIHTLAAKSKIDDIRAGFLEGKNDLDFHSVIIICNTRLTSHARRYAKCVGIQHIGWKTPKDGGLEHLIRSTKTYPVQIIRSLTKPEKNKLSAAGIVSLDDLMGAGSVPRVSPTRLRELKGEAKTIR